MTESDILRIWNGPTSVCNRAKILQFAADLKAKFAERPTNEKDDEQALRIAEDVSALLVVRAGEAVVLEFARRIREDENCRLRAESAQEPVKHFHAALTINPTYGAALWLDRRLVARIAADVANSVITPEDSEPQWHKDAMVFVNAVNAAPVAKPAAQDCVSVPIPDHIRGYNLLYQAAIEFVDKVERGEARSRRSYQSFKEALSLLAASEPKT